MQLREFWIAQEKRVLITTSENRMQVKVFCTMLISYFPGWPAQFN
jgi:hypothetical protein